MISFYLVLLIRVSTTRCLPIIIDTITAHSPRVERHRFFVSRTVRKRALRSEPATGTHATPNTEEAALNRAHNRQLFPRFSLSLSLGFHERSDADERSRRDTRFKFVHTRSYYTSLSVHSTHCLFYSLRALSGIALLYNPSSLCSFVLSTRHLAYLTSFFLNCFLSMFLRRTIYSPALSKFLSP